MKTMKLNDGSFRMHRGGEVDVRAAYCALVAAKLTNTFTPELFEGTAEWVARFTFHIKNIYLLEINKENLHY